MSAPDLDSKVDVTGEELRANAAHKHRERHVSRGKRLDIGAGTEIRRMLTGRELAGSG